MPDPTTYRVDVVKLGQWDWAPGFELYWMEPNAPAEPLALVGVVVRGGGKTVLVNTGPDPTFLPTMNARWAAFDPRHQLRVAADERLEPALAKVGVGVEEVDLVLVTPFQAYAIGNVLRLPRAEIGLSRRGWIDFHAPRWRQHPHDFRPFCIPDDVLVGLVTDAWPRVRLLADEEILVAYDRIRREADLLLPLYDPALFARHPDGRLA